MEKELIEAFLKFADEKGIELGGQVTHGFAMEKSTYRPMASEDYEKLISHFIESRSLNCITGFRGRLIKVAASLSLHKLSEFDDDYPRRFPKRVLREIEKHNDHLRDIAKELMAIKNAL